MPTSEVVWNRDPAASGWRDRALVGSGYFADGGKRFELMAYDDGRWEVRGGKLGMPVAHGREKDGDAAKAKCVKVWVAMRPEE